MDGVTAPFELPGVAALELASDRHANASDRDLFLGRLAIAWPEAGEHGSAMARPRVHVELVRLPCDRAEAGARCAGGGEAVAPHLGEVRHTGAAIQCDRADSARVPAPPRLHEHLSALRMLDEIR